jgi:hypothetical protein
MAPKVIAGAMHAKKTKNEIATVFWLKLLISERQCVPRVLFMSSTIPWPGRCDGPRPPQRESRRGSVAFVAHMLAGN